MKYNVVMDNVDVNSDGNHSKLLCAGQIPGAEVYHHKLESGSFIQFTANSGCFHILVTIDGAADFLYDNKTYNYAERVCFVPALDKSLTVKAVDNGVRFLEIQWIATEEDIEELNKNNTTFPIIQPYETSIQYYDRFKSQKTISRALIEQRVIPRFALGSVESYGYDIVNPHAHPPLDQFFYSFPENDMEVIIEDEKIPMEGDVLMHIPLGASHGVEVFDNKHMHYLWIDFMKGIEGAERLDRSHKQTGQMRSFDNEEK